MGALDWVPCPQFWSKHVMIVEFILVFYAGYKKIDCPISCLSLNIKNLCEAKNDMIGTSLDVLGLNAGVWGGGGLADKISVSIP